MTNDVISDVDVRVYWLLDGDGNGGGVFKVVLKNVIFYIFFYRIFTLNQFVNVWQIAIKKKNWKNYGLHFVNQNHVNDIINDVMV